MFLKVKDAWINMDRVAWIKAGPPGTTRVWFSGGEDDYVIVDEPPETIISMLPSVMKL